MSLGNIRKKLNEIGRYNFQEIPYSNKINNNNDVYDFIKILDKFKKNKDFSRLYKTDFDYDRDNNRISLIFSVNNLRKSKNFNSVFNSEYVKKLFDELEELKGISKNFIRKLRTKTNYALNMYGKKGIYQSPYYALNFNSFPNNNNNNSSTVVY